MPEEKAIEEMPWYVREILVAAEEFRVAALRELGQAWVEALPMIPLLREEMKALVRGQMEVDEQTVFRQLAQLGSMSAGLITDLRITREVVSEAMSVLRGDRAAQVTLVSILSATRFRVHYDGRVLDTVCEGCKVRKDSFEHMLQCYALTGQLRRGADSVKFLVQMAKKTKLSPPGVSRPFVCDL